MNKLSKGIVLISAAALTLGLAACGSSTNSDAGHVYFLNNKPEVVDQWNELADMYTKETGVQVDIQSATSGSYESTLSSELAKNNAPTMFGIGGFDQYAKYKNYLEPLQDSEAYKLLNEQGKQMAHKDGDDVYGLPYAAEWFGIIANKKIINEYAKKSYSVIKTFDDIKTDNPLVAAAVADQKSGKTQVSWNFTMMPSEQWKNDLGNALLEYAQGTQSWDAVKTAFVDGWAKEYSAAHAS